VGGAAARGGPHPPRAGRGGAEGNDDAEGPSAPLLQVRAEALAQMFEGTGVDLAALQARYEGAMQVDDVEGMALTLTVKNESQEVSAPNVVGILEGSDPVLKDEYVVFSGHMDHVGVGTPDENGDSIYNGADDDASGTVAVMQVAHAMTSLETAPKRSMIFLVVSGEEKGLWGSEYYAENPTVPIEQLVANINTDMVGRNWPDTIVAIGKEHSDLGETMNRINEEHPEIGMTAIDDIWPEERFYYRSDHFNFARKGVPVLFFFNGTHDDYHGRDDETDRIDADKAARIARLVFYLGVDVGNAAEKPKWNPESYQRIVSDL
jgi:Zn-dependent M28 family amino/carboxypeptidase